MSSKHDGIGEPFLHYKTACAVKAQAEKDLRRPPITKEHLPWRSFAEQMKLSMKLTLRVVICYGVSRNLPTWKVPIRTLEELHPENIDQGSGNSRLSQTNGSLDVLLASPKSDDSTSQTFIEYRKSMDSGLALGDSKTRPDVSTVPWSTFVHFPDQSVPIAPRKHGCECLKCRTSTMHNRGLVYKADIHLVDDMTSFIEAYIRWAAEKGWIVY